MSSATCKYPSPAYAGRRSGQGWSCRKCTSPFGLSACVRALETPARSLGGHEFRPAAADLHLEEVGLTSTPAIGVHPRASAVSKDLAPRPVTVVDAAYKKPLDLQVITAVEDF